LQSYVIEMVSDPCGKRLPRQLANPRGVITVICRRQGWYGGLFHRNLSRPRIVLTATIATVLTKTT